MRRTVAFAAAFAVAAAVVTYLTGPNILEYIYDSKSEKMQPTKLQMPAPGAGAKTVQSAHVDHGRPGVPMRPAAPRQAPVLGGRDVSRQTTKPGLVALRRTAVVRAPAAADAAIRGLEPASTADMRPSVAVASVAGTPAQGEPHDNPMDHRWIDSLSGQRAKLSMGVAPRHDRCPATALGASGCERPEAPKDVSLAGVVVKSQHLTRPGSPLEGAIARGHFRDKTPAVYVE